MIRPSVPEFLTCKEVGKILKCSPATVRNMIVRGDLEGIRLKTGRGMYRVPIQALNTLMRQGASNNSNDLIESRSVFNNLLNPIS